MKEKILTLKNYIEKRTILAYTLIFIFCALGIFASFIIYNKTFIWGTVDGYLQHYPNLVKIKDMTAQLIAGNGFDFWSWNMGLGTDVIGNYMCILFDPFTYIAILFPVKFLDVGYSLTIILKLYCAGLGMLWLGKEMNYRKYISIFGAISYCFCSFALGSFLHSFFIMSMALFPFFIVGAEKVFKKKSPILLIIVSFISLITNLYFTYMSGIFLVTFCIIRYFHYYKGYSVFNFFKVMFKFIGCALVGAIMSCAIIVPVVYALLNSSTGTGINREWIWSLDEYISFPTLFVSNSELFGAYSYIGAGAVLAVIIPFIFKKIKEKNSIAIMWLVTVIAMLVPACSIALNGGSYAIGRWAYVMAFFYIWSGQEVLSKPIKITKKIWIYWGTLAVWTIVVAGAFIWSVNPLSQIVAGINICMGLIFLHFFNETKDKKYLVLGTLIAGLILTNSIVFSPEYNTNFGDKYASVGRCYELYSKSVQKNNKKIDDNSFYRVDQVDNPEEKTFLHTASNESVVSGVNSIQGYFSTLDIGLHEYNQYLANCCDSRRVSVWGNDNRTRMDLLSGVKYFFSGNDPEGIDSDQYLNYGFVKGTNKKTDYGQIYTNKYSIGLGCTFDKYVTRSQWEKYSPIKKEQVLTQALVVEDNSQFKNTIKENDSLKFDDKNLLYLQAKPKLDNDNDRLENKDEVTLGKNEFEVKKANGKLKLQTQYAYNCEVYVYFKNIKRQMPTLEGFKNYLLDDDINNKVKYKQLKMDLLDQNYKYGFAINYNGNQKKKRAINSLGDAQGYDDVYDYCINLGYFEKFNGTINLSFNDVGKYTYDELKIVAVPMKNYDKQAKKLESNRFHIKKYHGDYVKGTVNENKDSILYLSIPKSDGWKVYIDGKETKDVEEVNIAFTGVKIPKGKHTVELKYWPVGFPYTIYVSLAGIGLLFVIIICVIIKSRKKKQPVNEYYRED